MIVPKDAVAISPEQHVKLLIHDMYGRGNGPHAELFVQVIMCLHVPNPTCVIFWVSNLEVSL